MFDTDIDRSRLDADATLRHVASMQALRQRAEVAVLEDAAHWADLHGVVGSDGSRALPGAERLVRFGGDGTPATCEFCPAELGAEMGMSPEAAAMLIGDALDLRHRLPILWERIRAGEVKPWIGRRVAVETRDLSVVAAAAVDHRVANYAHSLTWGRLSKVVQAAIVDSDPEFAQERADSRCRDHGVWLHPADEAGNIYGAFAAAGPDAIRFDAGLDRAADALGLLGDTESKQVRRARALGILGNPQQTFDLFAAAAAAARSAGCGDVTSDGRTDVPDGHPAADPGADPDRQAAASVRGETIRVDPRPRAVLYVHMTRDALDRGDGTGVARIEGIGPVTIDQAKEWLGDCAVTVTPVIDLAGIAPVDAYEIPDRIREAVHILAPADTFPYATNTGRRMDNDHTIAYVHPDTGGPPGQRPGQTRIGNLGPMTRPHHRIKTHSRWQVKQPYPGIYLWRSPHGRHYLVDHTGTHRLTSGDAA